jgi:hypothetical protein
VAVIVGKEFTTTLKVCVDEQMPKAPSIVYVVVTVGETVTLLPVKAPGFHE